MNAKKMLIEDTKEIIRNWFLKYGTIREKITQEKPELKEILAMSELSASPELADFYGFGRISGHARITENLCKEKMTDAQKAVISPALVASAGKPRMSILNSKLPTDTELSEMTVSYKVEAMKINFFFRNMIRLFSVVPILKRAGDTLELVNFLQIGYSEEDRKEARKLRASKASKK